MTTTTKLSLLGEQQPIAMRGRHLGERSRCSFLASSRWAGSSRPLLHPVFGSLLFTGYCYRAGGKREESGQTEGRGERKTPLRLLSVEHLLLPICDLCHPPVLHLECLSAVLLLFSQAVLLHKALDHRNTETALCISVSFSAQNVLSTFSEDIFLLFLMMCMCMSVCEHVSAGPRRPEALDPLGSSCCEPPDKDAGN